MRKATVVGLGLVVALTGSGCAKGARVRSASGPATPVPVVSSGPIATADGAGDNARREPADANRTSSTWIGASAEGDMLPTGTRETFLGVWVDVPDTRPAVRPPMELALVIDTSGSMAGAKIENARTAASALVRSLRDGDIVALDAFSDSARTVVPPTRLTAHAREDVLRAIAGLNVSGSTNMFDGLTLAEGQVAAAPATHGIRRIVVISDGIANVGPSSPETLGAIAERGLRFRAQVTSLGVGNDYDERTLNALAVRSSGRLYHLTEPREMANILKGELDLLDATLASDSFIEIVPAPGVALVGAEGIRADWHDTSGAERRALRIPLGALHAGQHREALVRVRIDDTAAFEGQTRSLASVRLRFRDAQDSDLERVQETVARTQLTGDSTAVASHVSSRTKAIVAIQDSAKIQMAAAQRINDGQFMDADKELARAEASLAAQARVVTAPAEKKRIADAQTKVAAARATTQAMPSKPKAAQRESALEMNASGMKAMGF
ncbi:MAG TPA: VWA domain-containing protein [Labilithrix sp.]|nr:VWA domain-containing protein [Labilithrix sp.]